MAAASHINCKDQKEGPSMVPLLSWRYTEHYHCYEHKGSATGWFKQTLKSVPDLTNLSFVTPIPKLATLIPKHGRNASLGCLHKISDPDSPKCWSHQHLPTRLDYYLFKCNVRKKCLPGAFVQHFFYITVTVHYSYEHILQTTAWRGKKRMKRILLPFWWFLNHHQFEAYQIQWSLYYYLVPCPTQVLNKWAV